MLSLYTNLMIRLRSDEKGPPPSNTASWLPSSQSSSSSLSGSSAGR